MVTQTFLGRDEHARVAEIKIGGSTFVRSMQKLVPLEVRSEATASLHQTSAKENEGSSVQSDTSESTSQNQWTRTQVVQHLNV